MGSLHWVGIQWVLLIAFQYVCTFLLQLLQILLILIVSIWLFHSLFAFKTALGPSTDYFFVEISAQTWQMLADLLAKKKMQITWAVAKNSPGERREESHCVQHNGKRVRTCRGVCCSTNERGEKNNLALAQQWLSGVKWFICVPFYAFLNFCPLSWSLNKTSNGIDSLTAAKRCTRWIFFRPR